MNDLDEISLLRKKADEMGEKIMALYEGYAIFEKRFDKLRGALAVAAGAYQCWKQNVRQEMFAEAMESLGKALEGLDDD